MLRAFKRSVMIAASVVFAVVLLLPGASRSANATQPVEPVQTTAHIEFTAGNLLSGGVLFQVPADRMFVAEQVSVQLSLPSGQSPVTVVLNGGLESFGPGGTEHNLAPMRMGAFPGGQENFAANHDVRIYFPPGNNVGYQVFRTDGANAGLAKGRISISGRLLECTKDIVCPGF